MTDSSAEIVQLPTEAKTEIVTKFPARPEFVILARTCTSAVASILEFGFDQVEDLRLAVDELCTLNLIDAYSTSELELRFTWTEESLVIACTLFPARQTLTAVSDKDTIKEATRDLAMQIIDSLVDEYDVGGLDGDLERGWICMNRTKVSG